VRECSYGDWIRLYDNFLQKLCFFCILLCREMRLFCRRHWIWFIRIIMSMWLCYSMHHGVLFLGYLDRFFLSFLPYILLFLILLLKNHQLGQGLCLFVFFGLIFLSFLASFVSMIISFLQYFIQVWCPWFPYIIHFEFYYACTVSWISDPWLSRRFLQWCYWWVTAIFLYFILALRFVVY
jgi:hypothetical protein